MPNVGIGTTTPLAILDVTKTGTNSAIIIPRDTTANRPAGNATNGMIRYNTNTSKFEAFENNAWVDMIATAGSSLPAAAGPASAPGYAFVGNTNTGMYLNNINTLGFATGGTSRMTVDASGNVGIGTTAPDSLLHVYSTSTSSTQVLHIASEGEPGAVLEGASNTSNYNPEFWFRRARGTTGSKAAVQNGDNLGGQWFEGYQNGAFRSAAAVDTFVDAAPSGNNVPGRIDFSTNNGTSFGARMTIKNNGNVGIGTSTPLAALDITSANSNSAIIVPRETTANRPAGNVTNGMIRYNTNTSKFEAYQAGAWTDMISNGGSNLAVASPASAPGYAFVGNTNTGMFLNNINTLGFATGGTARMTIDAAGSVKLTGQISVGSQTISGGTNSINWDNGNMILTDYDCASSIDMANIKDGGTYTLVVTGTGMTQCNFNTTTTGVDAGTVTYKFKPANDARFASTTTVYTLMRVGNLVLVSWGSGFE